MTCAAILHVVSLGEHYDLRGYDVSVLHSFRAIYMKREFLFFYYWMGIGSG